MRFTLPCAETLLNEEIARKVLAASGKSIQDAPEECLRIMGRIAEREARLDVSRVERKSEMLKRSRERGEADPRVAACFREDMFKPVPHRGSRNKGRRREPKKAAPFFLIGYAT